MDRISETAKVKALEYLDHARPVAGSNRFVIGTYERNITLFRQQMRALNLIFALRVSSDEAPSDPPIAKIAIIGGGAFGVTAAAAAASIGIDAYIYEQHQILLPFQRGCDTRWVNPLYYDWPEPGAESRYAGLPIMNWKSGTASEVADQLVAELEKIKESTKRIVWRAGVRDLHVFDETIDDGRQTFRVSCRYDGNEQETMRFDAMVYATGFGVEHDLGGKTTSYWRNDNLGQLELKGSTRQSAQRYLISGVGDGGLTDVARLKISDFHHERLFFELFDDASSALRQALQKLAVSARADGLPASWLYDQFQSLATPDPDQGPFGPAITRLKRRLRKDTEVWLNGRPADFSDTLSLSKVSLSNALMGYLLHRIGAFKYLAGALQRDGTRWSVSGHATFKMPTNVVVRHGTSREAPLKEVGFEDAIPVLKTRANGHSTTQRLFPAGWWASNRRPAPGVANAPIVRPAEFAPPTTVTIATTFISTLSDVLVALLKARDQKQDRRDSPPLIRMTLHRVARIGEEEVFQQISPYRGLLLERQKGGTGRVFPVAGGMVGLAMRIGRPILFRRTGPLDAMKSATDFEKLLAQPIEDHVDSMLACPFFAASGDSADDALVNFVLFADTSDLSFFEDANLRLVYAACKGFVDNIEASLQEGALRQISSSYAGRKATDSLTSEQIEHFREVGITFDDQVFATHRSDLTFQSLRSTELDDALGIFRS
jgi:hypothetical protein